MDPLHAVCPPDFILLDTQRAMLVCVDSKKIKTVQDITALLEESDDWDAEWSAKIFRVVMQFETEYACISEKLTTQRKRK